MLQINEQGKSVGFDKEAKDFVENNTTKIIANLYSANGTIPVYEIKYANKNMGLFLSRVGASACVAGLEEI